MSTTLSEAVVMVYRALRDLGDDEDTQLLTDTEVEGAITAAFVRHSLSHPRVVVEALIADGTSQTDLPVAFVDEAVLRQVEYPTAQVPPSVMDERSYVIWQTPSGRKLMWLATVPGDGDAVWITYTQPHTIDDDPGSTLSDAMTIVVCDLAASIAADWIAAKYASTHDQVMAADTVSYRTKAQEWQSVSRRAFERYKGALSGSVDAAGGRLNWDTRLAHGQPLLTHDRWNR
jgi:hypothetical protein